MTHPTQFTCVVQLMSCYAAAHVDGQKQTFISDLATDISVARRTAAIFADAHAIPYSSAIRTPTPPIITVLKHEGKWFPAELHADKIHLLLNLGPRNLDGNLQEAISVAQALALHKKSDCIPSIGISFERNTTEATR